VVDTNGKKQCTFCRLSASVTILLKGDETPSSNVRELIWLSFYDIKLILVVAGQDRMSSR
jgi:hypothetical protein